MKKTVRLFIPLISMFALFSGCTVIEKREGAAPGMNVRDQNLPNARIRMNTVNILDKSLQDWRGDEVIPSAEWLTGSDPSESRKKGKIAVENTNSRRTPTGTLEVWAVLRNRTDFPLQVEGRSTFFDELQVPTDKPTAWKIVNLPPNGISAYRGFSLKKKVSFYYIELREGR